MILGSDSHTRYGALGTMAVGEGGPELAKQLLKNTWDIPYPKVVLVYLTGSPRRGVGPHDVAIALVKATFASGFVNNCVLEFLRPRHRGSAHRLPQRHRCDDHGDHLPHLHLGDGLRHRGFLPDPPAARRLPGAAPGGRRVV